MTELIESRESRESRELREIAANFRDFKRAHPNGKPMSADVYRALVHIIRYLANEEELHYWGMRDDGEDVSDHVFHHALKVVRWIEGL